MKTGRISQLLAGFAEGDAISGEVRWMRDVFRRWGFESEIFADRRHVSPAMQPFCRGLDEFASGGDDVVLHHYSISSPAIDAFESARGRKVLVYHNITPARYFLGYDARTAAALDLARLRLPGIAAKADRLWADSAFNAAELRGMGAADADVFHLPFDPQAFGADRDRHVEERLSMPLTNILFVGRMAPNKRVEALILAFAWYHRAVNRQSRLVLVGSDRSCPRYYLMLRMLANELELPNVCFERYAAPGGLPVYYGKAAVFVTASEHEGFCMPLLEAMHHRVPVVARRAGGMPEAMAGAGILYDDASASELAALIHCAVADPLLRGEVLASQDRRMREAASRDAEGELRRLLDKLTG